jgi:hypothetical protein
MAIHAQSPWTFTAAAITGCGCHNQIPRKKHKTVLTYAVPLTIGLAWINIPQYPITNSACSTSLFSPSRDNSTSPIIHTETQCSIWEVNGNPIKSFGVKLKTKLDPSCLTVSDVAGMQISALRSLAGNSPLIQHLNEWIEDGPLKGVNGEVDGNVQD